MDKSVIDEGITSARARLAVYFQQLTPPVAQETIDRANAHLQTLVKNATMGHYTPLDKAIGILQSGRFKTVYEREQEVGEILGPGYTAPRRIVERNVFGVPVDETTERPVYGFLSNQYDGDATRYGDVKMILSDVVRSDGTMTRSDTYLSLANHLDVDPKTFAFAAVPLSEVTIEIIAPDILRTYSPFDIERLFQCQTLDDLHSLLGNDYFEAQLHGAVGVQHIERIFLKRGIISPVLQKWAQSLKIPVATMK